MSLTADVLAYLGDLGIIDGSDWLGQHGGEHRTKEGRDKLIIISRLPAPAQPVHGVPGADSYRNQGFQLRVRAGQHQYETAETKFWECYQALQDKHAAFSASASVSGTYVSCRSDLGAPIVSFDTPKERPNLTVPFEVIEEL